MIKALTRMFRKKTRTAAYFSRSFDAGKQSRFFTTWTTTPESADQYIYRNARMLRARARDMVWRNAYAKRYVSLLRSHVLGHKGIQLQAQATLPGGELDETANGAIEGAWRRWQKFADYKGRGSFNSIMQTALYSLLTDGEAFIRIRRGRNAGPFAFQIELIDPETIQIEHNVENTGTDNYIRFGIEYNPAGRPVAYHIRRGRNNLHTYGTPGPVRTTRIPAGDIIHVYRKDMTDQRRGISWLGTVLGDIKMHDGYMEAAVVAAREGASKMGFIMLPNNELMPAQETASGERIMNSEAGEWRQFPEGTNIETYNPAYPSGEMPSFIKSCLRSIASGLGVSYNTLANDLEGVNFSSMRHGAIEDRDQYKMIQEWLIELVYMPLYEQWLPIQLTLGIDAGGQALSNQREQEYRRVEWMPRRWAWIDPKAEAETNQMMLDMKVASRVEIIRDRGRDPDKVDEEIENDENFTTSTGSSNEIENTVPGRLYSAN